MLDTIDYESLRRKVMKFSTVWDHEYWMKSNGFYCGINMPNALISHKNGREEVSHGLPPYEKRKTFLVDEYPACPKTWSRSEGIITSYFVPVQEDKGLWLDFNKNSEHKYDVAIVISIQGINPITGLPCNDANLEQYIDQCPKHKIAFGPERYCKKCGYKWPKQNYISTTCTPSTNFWLDGFRTAEGVVRQYILSMDKIKGVANNIVGKDRVFAIGLSYFISKKEKPESRLTVGTRSPFFIQTSNNSNNWDCLKSSAPFKSSHWAKCSSTSTGLTKGTETYDSSDIKQSDVNQCFLAAPAPAPAAAAAPVETHNYSCDSINIISSEEALRSRRWSKVKLAKLARITDNEQVTEKQLSRDVRSIDVQKVEVGAGANIKQVVGSDPESLDFWRSSPEAIIYINYCLEDDCSKIIKGGKISLEGHKESFLKDIPTGN